MTHAMTGDDPVEIPVCYSGGVTLHRTTIDWINKTSNWMGREKTYILSTARPAMTF
jgi:hypothetical protein